VNPYSGSRLKPLKPLDVPDDAVVNDPGRKGQCWAIVRPKPYMGRMAPEQCRARCQLHGSGRLTCHVHSKLEAAAQAAKATLQETKAAG